ncbi:hypothetical protein [Streptomyces buecherae]|uniref:hypothetical protein n=1 Tax=Streptomyces buecherae TaxID=2763006 RepID=UPI0020B86A0F|nr:hypothetical protein [Streptomyces buecherae]
MSDRFAISLKVRGLGLMLAVVRSLRVVWPPATAEELEQFETDVLARTGLRTARSAGIGHLELQHKVEIHRMTGRVIDCPIDELNRPRGSKGAALRSPPSGAEAKTLSAGCSGELVT